MSKDEPVFEIRHGDYVAHRHGIGPATDDAHYEAAKNNVEVEVFEGYGGTKRVYVAPAGAEFPRR